MNSPPWRVSEGGSPWRRCWLIDGRTAPEAPHTDRRRGSLTHSGFLHYGTTLSPDGHWLTISQQRPDEDDAIFRFPIEGEQVGPPELLIVRSTGYQTSYSRSGRFRGETAS